MSDVRPVNVEAASPTADPIERLQLLAINAIAARQMDVATAAITAIAQRERGDPPRPGVCRFCGCQQQSPCGIVRGNGIVVTCGWIDHTETVCSNLACLQAYEAETGKELVVVDHDVQTSAPLLHIP